ncbi:hypothetical protein BCV71DRAFT_259669 [Rhizopus microsporus]|uniref:Uncharacterized protein n=1 Tax=Rhizopus microsporus TaxID=58291 RepID=A0A1X0SFY3_RHIZD|nr:hypothetical protein BCV71DRAFT_259669 [Rhizopus microsporus]
MGTSNVETKDYNLKVYFHIAVFEPKYSESNRQCRCTIEINFVLSEMEAVFSEIVSFLSTRKNINRRYRFQMDMAMWLMRMVVLNSRTTSLIRMNLWLGPLPTHSEYLKHVACGESSRTCPILVEESREEDIRMKKANIKWDYVRYSVQDKAKFFNLKIDKCMSASAVAKQLGIHARTAQMWDASVSWPNIEYACAQVLARCILVNEKAGHAVLVNILEAYCCLRSVDVHRELSNQHGSIPPPTSYYENLGKGREALEEYHDKTIRTIRLTSQLRQIRSQFHRPSSYYLIYASRFLATPFSCQPLSVFIFENHENGNNKTDSYEKASMILFATKPSLSKTQVDQLVSQYATGKIRDILVNISSSLTDTDDILILHNRELNNSLAQLASLMSSDIAKANKSYVLPNIQKRLKALQEISPDCLCFFCSKVALAFCTLTSSTSSPLSDNNNPRFILCIPYLKFAFPSYRQPSSSDFCTYGLFGSIFRR